MSTYAVIGASRGIGLEFVRQLAARPDATVFATIRSMRTATHLLAAAKDLNNVHILEADVTDFPALERAAKQVAEVTGGTLDCLIHNAARTGSETLRYGFNDFPSMDALDEDLIETFRINTLGVIHSIKAFSPLLQASKAPLKKIAVVNSGVSDPNFTLLTGAEGTASSALTKAATLMVAAKWAVMLKEDNISVASFHPGVVDVSETRGELGDSKPAAFVSKRLQAWKDKGVHLELLTPAQSVAGQLKALDELTMEKTGSFLTEKGVPWAI